MDAKYYETINNNSVKCTLCPHFCVVGEGGAGRCRVRRNEGGKLLAESYGRVTAMAIDPIEKKPLRMFMPGDLILSVSSYGCNMSCPFCQNHHLSCLDGDIEYKEISPYDLALIAKEYKNRGNIGIAYTYNEPVTSYEFILDTARHVHDFGIKNVLVTNGFINPAPLAELLPFIDAAAIDLKSVKEDFYKAAGGGLTPVLHTITAAFEAGVHVEVINLVISGVNDSDEEMEELSSRLGAISKDIPLHLTRFRPMHLYKNKPPTTHETVKRLAGIARKNMNVVFI